MRSGGNTSATNVKTGVCCVVVRTLSGGLRNGFYLTQDDASACFAIILHNVRTYRSAGVVAVVRGKRRRKSR